MIRTITKPALAAISTAANMANKSTVFNDISCCDHFKLFYDFVSEKKGANKKNEFKFRKKEYKTLPVDKNNFFFDFTI